MKKITLLAALLVAFTMSAQLEEGFEDVDALLANPDWDFVNVSDVPNLDYGQGSGSLAGGPFDAQAGGPDDYLVVNFNSTTGSIIDNYAILPTISLVDGDEISFFTRTASPSNFPDRLELRLSLDGDTSTLPTSSDVGSFTTLLVEINPALTVGGYPEAWTEFTVTISGVPTATDARIAFRYFVTDGGPAGSNSNIIGIDTLTVDAASLGIEDFEQYAFGYSLNNNDLRLTANQPIEQVEVYSILGQRVLQNRVDASDANISLASLNTGIYLTKVTIDGQSETFKIVKR